MGFDLTQSTVRGSKEIEARISTLALLIGDLREPFRRFINEDYKTRRYIFDHRGVRPQGGRPWKPLAPSTIARKKIEEAAGIIPRGVADKPNMRTASLFKSVTRPGPHNIRIIEKHYAETGSDLPYARIIQAGVRARGSARTPVPGRSYLKWSKRENERLLELLEEHIAANKKKRFFLDRPGELVTQKQNVGLE